jgi:hypothetical protein
MIGLVHISLGSSYLIAHVLHYPLTVLTGSGWQLAALSVAIKPGPVLQVSACISNFVTNKKFEGY